MAGGSWNMRFFARCMAVMALAIWLAPCLFTPARSPLAAEATALTFPVAAHESVCFYALIKEKHKKISFYFAVHSGGNFDINFMVSDPDYMVVVMGDGEGSGDYVFAGEKEGEYSFCFMNDMSTVAEKVVNMELSVEGEHESPLSIPPPPSSGNKALNPDTAKVDETVFRIGTQMSNYDRAQKYYRTRENRNFNTVQSTESKVYWYAITQSAMIIGMALLQVYAVRSFFQGAPGKMRI